MATSPVHFMQRQDWLDWLSRQSLPPSVQPHLIACATPDGAQRWLEDETHPREAHVAHSALEGRKNPLWHDAVATDRRLATLEAAFMHVLVATLLDQPGIQVQPSDWVVRALVDELGRDIPARAILDGDQAAIAAISAWLDGPDSTTGEQPDAEDIRS